jgi:hypothetical protein
MREVSDPCADSVYSVEGVVRGRGRVVWKLKSGASNSSASSSDSSRALIAATSRPTISRVFLRHRLSPLLREAFGGSATLVDVEVGRDPADPAIDPHEHPHRPLLDGCAATNDGLPKWTTSLR